LARVEYAWLTGIVFDPMQSRGKEHTASGKSTANGIKQTLLGNAGRCRKSSRQTLKLAELRAKVKQPAAGKTGRVSAVLGAEFRYWLRSERQAERDTRQSSWHNNLPSKPRRSGPIGEWRNVSWPAS